MSSTNRTSSEEAYFSGSCCSRLAKRVAAVEKLVAKSGPGVIYGIRSLVERNILQMQNNQSKIEGELNALKNKLDFVAETEKLFNLGLIKIKNEVDTVDGMVSSGLLASLKKEAGVRGESVVFTKFSFGLNYSFVSSD